jgi:hypothetical protein
MPGQRHIHHNHAMMHAGSPPLLNGMINNM